MFFHILINLQISPIEVTEGKTNLDKIYTSATNSDDATHPTVIGMEKVKEVRVKIFQLFYSLEVMYAIRCYLFHLQTSKLTEKKTNLEKTLISKTKSKVTTHSTVIGLEKDKEVSIKLCIPTLYFYQFLNFMYLFYSQTSSVIGLEKFKEVDTDKNNLNTSLTNPGAHCLRGMDISMDCGSHQYRERREVQWINFCKTTKDEIQDWKLSNMSLPNLLGPYEAKRSRGNEVILYILSGSLLFLAAALGWYFARYHFDYIRQ